LYTTHVEGQPAQGVINKFNIHSSEVWSAQDAQKPSALIGHQGIAIDPQSEWRKFLVLFKKKQTNSFYTMHK